MTQPFKEPARSRRLPEEDASRHIDSMMPVRPVRPTLPSSIQVTQKTEALPVKTRKQLRLERMDEDLVKPVPKTRAKAVPTSGTNKVVEEISVAESSAIMDGEADEYSFRDKRLRKLGREFSLIVCNDDVIADPWVFNSSFSERQGEVLEPGGKKKHHEEPEVDLQTLESRVELLLERFCAKKGIQMKPASH